MIEKEKTKTRIVLFRLSPEEYRDIESKWKKSTIRKFSEFLRRIIFHRPITVYTRNRSLDELMPELMLLRKELNGIGNNFNQVVHKLHTLDHVPQVLHWAASWDSEKLALFNKIEEIRTKLNSISDQWLQ